MRAVRELQELAVGRRARCRSPSPRRRCASRSPIASNIVIGAPPLRPASSARPRRRDVVAGRRDDAHAGDRHAALLHRHALLGDHARARSPTGLPSACADSMNVASPSRPGRIRAPRPQRAARRRERAHLDVGHARRHEVGARGQRDDSAATRERERRSARRAAASPETPGAAESDRRRTAPRAAPRACRGATSRHAAVARARAAGRTPWKRSGGAPPSASVAKHARIAAGSSNSASGSIGPTQSGSSITRSPPMSRPAVVGDRVVVAGLDRRSRGRACRPGAAARTKRVSCASAATGRPRKPSFAIATQAASWPIASASRHDGNASIAGRDAKRAARARAGHERGDPVDERERGEVIRSSGCTRRSAGRLRVALRPDDELANVSGVNRRGMSATFIGDLMRSAGTSDRIRLAAAPARPR